MQGLAGPLLGEWVGWHRMLAIIAGFFGVLVMHPGIGSVHWAMLIALVATLGYAVYNIATRYLAAFDPATVTQTYPARRRDRLAAPRACGMAMAGDTSKRCCSPRSGSGAGSVIGS